MGSQERFGGAGGHVGGSGSRGHGRAEVCPVSRPSDERLVADLRRHAPRLAGAPARSLRGRHLQPRAAHGPPPPGRRGHHPRRAHPRLRAPAARLRGTAAPLAVPHHPQPLLRPSAHRRPPPAGRRGRSDRPAPRAARRGRPVRAIRAQRPVRAHARDADGARQQAALLLKDVHGCSTAELAADARGHARLGRGPAGPRTYLVSDALRDDRRRRAARSPDLDRRDAWCCRSSPCRRRSSRPRRRPSCRCTPCPISPTSPAAPATPRRRASPAAGSARRWPTRPRSSSPRCSPPRRP